MDTIRGKAGNLVGRAASLRKWARDRGFDLAVSHNSYAHIAAAAGAGNQSRYADGLRASAGESPGVSFSVAGHRAAGVSRDRTAASTAPRLRKVHRYDGIKEDVYLADFEPDPDFADDIAPARY